MKKLCEKIVELGIQYRNEKIREKFEFPETFRFYDVSFEGNITVGENTYINERSRIDSGPESIIVIGNYCAIGRNVHITSKTHKLHQPTADEDHPKILHVEMDVIIGDYIWIGDNVLILPGVKINDYAVIGANSIVNRNVKSFEIVAGSPIKHIRFNTDHYKYSM